MANFSFLTVLTFIGASLLTLTQADNHGVTFLYPTQGLTLNYLDTVNVTYLSPFPTPKLYTFCVNSTGNLLSKLIQNVTSYNSSELVVLSWPKMKSCYFDLRPNSSAGYGANSPSILLNSTVRSTPITIGLADLSTTPTATSSPSSSLPATAASSTSSSTSSPPSSGSSNKNSHTGIGVGVGVGLGAAAVIAFVGFAIVYFFRRRSRNMARGAAVPDHDSQSDSQKWQWQQPPDHGVYMQPVNQKPHEMAAENMHELPADPGAHEMSHEGYDAAGGGAQQPKKEWRFSWEANQTPRA